MQSNPEWSIAAGLSLTLDVKKKKIPCFVLCKPISYEIKGETPRKHSGHPLMSFKEGISWDSPYLYCLASYPKITKVWYSAISEKLLMMITGSRSLTDEDRRNSGNHLGLIWGNQGPEQYMKSKSWGLTSLHQERWWLNPRTTKRLTYPTEFSEQDVCFAMR